MFSRITILSLFLLPIFSAQADIDRGKEAYYMGEYERAIAKFMPAAENGNAYALIKIGFMAENGWGSKKDYNLAHRYYERAAILDDPQGHISLAKLYAYGKGVDKDENNAKEHLLKAVDLGESHAYYILASFYNDYLAFGENPDEALKWYLLAAAKNAAAYSRNGHYTTGRGQWFRLDTNEGVIATRKAADEGNIYAQFNTGLRYHYGEGVGVNYEIAEQYFLKAAKAGHAESQRFIGQNHALQYKEKNNNILIDKWFTIAAMGGNKEAQRNKVSIERNMTPNDISLAEKAAMDWLEQH